MLRSEVTTGLNALRYMLEKASGFKYSSEDDKEYYDEVLTEAIRAVLLNEQNDPHSK